MTPSFTKQMLDMFDEKFIILNSGQILVRQDLLHEGMISPKDNIKSVKSFLTSSIELAYEKGRKEKQVKPKIEKLVTAYTYEIEQVPYIEKLQDKINELIEANNNE